MTTILQTTHQGGPAGSTRSIFDLSRHLAKRGARVIVACRAGTLLAELIARAEQPGLEHRAFDYEPRATLSRRFQDLIATERVDLVNSHATHDRRALAWLRIGGGLPQAFVVTRRTMPLTWFPEVTAVGLAADRTIAVSASVADALRHRGHPSGTLRVVTNGIALDRLKETLATARIAEARAHLPEVNGLPVVAMLARNKDQGVLIDALEHVERPILLALVGIEGDAEQRARAAMAPKRHRVAFVPFSGHGAAFYAFSTVAVLASRIEGLSQSLLEAMAAGVRVSASDSGGNRDLIRHGENGLLVPALDPRAWGRAIEMALADAEKARRWAEAGRATVHARYTIEHTVRATEAVYEEALQRRGRDRLTPALAGVNS